MILREIFLTCLGKLTVEFWVLLLFELLLQQMRYCADMVLLLLMAVNNYG